MPAKRYKVPLSASSQKIRKARIKLRHMTDLEKIELMVKAGVMSEAQAERAKKNLQKAPA